MSAMAVNVRFWLLSNEQNYFAGHKRVKRYNYSKHAACKGTFICQCELVVLMMVHQAQ